MKGVDALDGFLLASIFDLLHYLNAVHCSCSHHLVCILKKKDFKTIQKFREHDIGKPIKLASGRIVGLFLIWIIFYFEI